MLRNSCCLNEAIASARELAIRVRQCGQLFIHTHKVMVSIVVSVNNPDRFALHTAMTKW
jgi:hypothetical protein